MHRVCIYIYILCVQHAREYAHTCPCRAPVDCAGRHRQVDTMIGKIRSWGARDPSVLSRFRNLSSPFRASCPRVVSVKLMTGTTVTYTGKGVPDDRSRILIAMKALDRPRTAVLRHGSFTDFFHSVPNVSRRSSTSPSLPWISLYERATCADKRNFIIRALLISRGNSRTSAITSAL